MEGFPDHSGVQSAPEGFGRVLDAYGFFGPASLSFGQQPKAAVMHVEQGPHVRFVRDEPRPLDRVGQGSDLHAEPHPGPLDRGVAGLLNGRMKLLC